MYHYTRSSERKRHTAEVATIGQALGGGHGKSMVGKKFRCQFRNDASFGNVVPCLFVQALHMPRSKNSSGVHRPKYKKKCTSRLCRPASIRVHVGVRNVYSSARSVGAARRRRRLIEAIWRRIARIACSSRRRSLRKKVAQKKRFWAYLYQVDVQTKHGSEYKIYLRHKTK